MNELSPTGSACSRTGISFSLPFLRKKTIVFAVLVAALALGTRQQASLWEAHHSLAHTVAQLGFANQRLAILAEDLARSNRQLKQIAGDRAKALAELARARHDLQQAVPDSAWTEPPTSWPQWNSDSPYVWLRKEILPMLPVTLFDKSGALSRELARVLAIDEATRSRLNAKLTQVLADFHQAEAANAERVAEPLPGIGGEGPTVTVRVGPLPEQGARAREEFQAALREALGEQRAELVQQTAEGWLASQFAASASVPKVISVRRHPDRRYSIAIRQGSGGSLSVGGVSDLDEYVPPHLQPLLEDPAAQKQE